MNVLLLAPHPFYQDRGTPIAVDLLVRVLSERGENVDILTYHEGSDRAYRGPGRVTIHRISRPPACANIRPGFSGKKLMADAYMYRRAVRLVRAKRYDVVHAVEESAFMARRIKRRFGIPYVFDMDSSMPEQMVEKTRAFGPFLPMLRKFERAAIRDAAAVAAVCDSLADLATASGAHKVTILRDVPLLDTGWENLPAHGFRAELGLTGPCFLYIGNLERYQGIDLLLDSFARFPAETGAHLVVIGGNPAHVAAYRRRADELGIGARAHLVGPRPISDMSALMAEADILVSPRIKGTNTPMKIYSYMASGRAIVVTSLFTHTQVLTEHTAMLADPNVDSFARAMRTLLDDANLRERLGRQALQTVNTDYSMDVFRKTVNELYDWLAREANKP